MQTDLVNSSSKSKGEDDDKPETFIYQNNLGYEIHMIGLDDTSSMTQQIGFMIVAPTGKMSDVTSIKRSKLLTNKNAYDFIFDFIGEFDKDDITAIKIGVMNKLKNMKIVEVSEKVNIEDAHYSICNYVKEYKVQDFVFLDANGYCIIDAKKFASIIGSSGIVVGENPR